MSNIVLAALSGTNSLAKNTTISIALSGNPAAIAVIGVAAIAGGVAVYGIHKYFESKFN